MGDVKVFKDRQDTAEFTCVECGKLVVSFAHRDDKRICALCRHLPGWRQTDDGRLIPPEAGEKPGERPKK